MGGLIFVCVFFLDDVAEHQRIFRAKVFHELVEVAEALGAKGPPGGSASKQAAT